MAFQYVFGLEDKSGKFTLFTQKEGISDNLGSGFTIFDSLGTVDNISEETDQFGAVGKVSTVTVVLKNGNKSAGKLIFDQANLFNLNRVFVYEVHDRDWGSKDVIFNGRIDSMSFLGTEIKLSLR